MGRYFFEDSNEHMTEDEYDRTFCGEDDSSAGVILFIIIVIIIAVILRPGTSDTTKPTEGTENANSNIEKPCD